MPLTTDRLLTCLCAVPALFLAGSVAWAQDTGDSFVETARVTTRIRVLKSTWQREHVENDPVSTQIMEARVTGQQTTSVSVRLGAQVCEPLWFGDRAEFHRWSHP